MTTKAPRPTKVPSTTTKFELACGKMYVTIGGDKNGINPSEVMVSLGKAGSCTKCQNEALTRMITLSLRHLVPVEEVIEELEGLECPSKLLFPEEKRALSCPDVIARALKRYLNGDD